MPAGKLTSQRYRALIQLLRTAEDLWNASRVFFSRWDLSPSQFNVLNLLYDRAEGLSQSDLSRLLIMHRSNVTGLVDRLAHRGLVRRHDDASDRRVHRILLTPDGTQLLEQIYPHYYAASDRVWADLPDTRIEELVDELQSIAANAGAIALLSSTQASPKGSPSRSRKAGAFDSQPPSAASTPADDSGGSSLRTSDL